MREALWLLALLLAGYAAFEFLRALRLPRTEKAAARGAAPERAGAEQGRAAAESAADALADADDDFLDYAPRPAALAGDPAPPAPPPSAALPDYAAERFELELENSRLRQALQAQRDLVALQQGEINRLVEDISALRDQIEGQSPAAASSPEYAEALVLAGQGLNAEMIAERCGISLAEAALVLSLARRDEGAR
ncbi:DUF2802 domain-containing protein [Thauera sp.]|jgi:hypothetical protein|uniref:DUF2802 domain-containing protein n=1 Tax=Thauera sp. TaxID=1905334 RepID=UPI00260A43FE|nr:DUF2802 domain-containing protein [Thauera sp.]